MKIWILSDLHHDVAKIGDLLEYPEADVVVLAGDIQNEKLVRELERRYETVVYVAGNHEFYGYDHAWRVQDLQNKFPKSFLEGDVRAFDGHRFLGVTLWTDYALYGQADRNHAKALAESFMSDHTKIMNFAPLDAEMEHVWGKGFLKSWLEDGKSIDGANEKTIVVTHHAPSPGSIHERYQGNPLNPAFASNLTDIILKYQPALWIHGHVHNSFDYMIGNTRVICNPRGYGTENPNFNPSLVIEI